jgi:hypothetical protein
MTSSDGLPDLATYEERFRLDEREEGTSETGDRILVALRQADISSLTREQLDLLDDLASALMGTISAELLRRDGWVRKPGWIPTESSPPGEFVTVDHAYRLVHEEEERWLYISEPYPQTGERLADLATLSEEGWHVDVRAGLALHYPGHTLRIQIERAGALTDPAEQSTRRLPRLT